MALVQAGAAAGPIGFSGDIDFIERDLAGGLFSNIAIGTFFTGEIDDSPVGGFIDDGTTSVDFDSLIAAGGLSVTNDFQLSADDAEFFNDVAGEDLFNAGDFIDILDIEGDEAISGGGRIEVGLSLIFDASAFGAGPVTFIPFTEEVPITTVFFIVEENSAGDELYNALGVVDELVFPNVTLTGTTVADTILGGLGSDVLTGLQGDDIIGGAAGDDILVGGAGGDTLDGAVGVDTADYSASGEAVAVAVDGSFATGGDAEGDALFDIENLLGSAFADFLRGDGQANVLTGGAGADYIQGRGGDDTLNGGENDDLLEPGAGADTVDGGSGQDLLSALDAAGPVTIDLGNVALSSAGYADKTLISIEGVLGVAGFGNTLVGGGGEDLLIGGDVADSIAGAGGADILLGLGGADTISGGAGDDLILGLEGDDVLTGDAGRDLFLFEPGDGADVVTDFELPVGGSGFEDRLFFSGLGLTFADLDIAEVGGDVVIGYGTNPAAFDGSVTVEGVTLAELVPGGAQPDWILVF